MNEANKNEVDLLLRSFARGQNEGGSASTHLDADELNSYAEGQVPVAARLRYTEHLADCPSCRGIVVGLTQAAGAVTHREPLTESKSGFWRSVSTFLSSPALRYAVPALVLTVVIGVGLIVFRQQRTPDLVAKNQPENAAAPAESAVRPNPVIEPSPSVSPTTFDAAARSTVEVDGADKSRTRADKAPVEVPLVADSTVPKGGRDSGEAIAGAGTGVFGQQPLSAAKAAEPPPPIDERKLEELARESNAKRQEQERAASRDEYKTKDDEDIHGPNRARNAPAPASQRAGDTLSMRGGPSANKNNTNEVETRTVAGKRFTRGSAGWVDTEYGSQSMTRLARGSEQYRALVADEPGIRTIAERLDGVVILVWKGRAYRIQ